MWKVIPWLQKMRIFAQNKKMDTNVTFLAVFIQYDLTGKGFIVSPNHIILWAKYTLLITQTVRRSDLVCSNTEIGIVK